MDKFVDNKTSVDTERTYYVYGGKGINYSYSSIIPDVGDNSYSLGSGDNPWFQGYIREGKLNSSVQITSDRKLKNSIEYDISKYDKIFDTLKPVSYKYNDSNSDRIHLGFIAQDVQEAIMQASLTTKDYAILTIEGEGFDSKQGLVTDEEKTTYRLRYDELHALEVRQIQLLKQEVKELKAQIEELKNLKTE